MLDKPKTINNAQNNISVSASCNSNHSDFNEILPTLKSPMADIHCKRHCYKYSTKKSFEMLGDADRLISTDVS